MEKLELLIGYQEAQWLSNTLWLQFVSQISELTACQGKAADLQKVIQECKEDEAKLDLISSHIHILELSLSFTMI
jgi:hypothetical protein